MYRYVFIGSFQVGADLYQIEIPTPYLYKSKDAALGDSTSYRFEKVYESILLCCVTPEETIKIPYDRFLQLQNARICKLKMTRSADEVFQSLGIYLPEFGEDTEYVVTESFSALFKDSEDASWFISNDAYSLIEEYGHEQSLENAFIGYTQSLLT